MGGLAEIRRRKRGAVARALTLVENEPRRARAMLREMFPHCGKSTIVGVTGPAGAGKSTLIGRVAAALASGGMRPAVLAVDPTSHVTGGAIMGDRARMPELDGSGVYVRSMASRGSRGALSASVRDCIRVLEYARYDPVIVESVGAGQTEVDIASIADITVVVFSPQTGDSIQAIKAGLTEIGDIYVINKSDLAGAAQLHDSVREFAATGPGGQERDVMRVSSRRPSTAAALARRIAELAAERRRGRRERYADRLESELRDIVLNSVRDRAVSAMSEGNARYERCVRDLRAGRVDPHGAAQRILGALA